MKHYTVQVLQCGGDWCSSLLTAGVVFTVANEEAVRINSEHFTATRVLDDMGHVILYVLPQFHDLAYPGAVGAAAREVLAKFNDL